MNGVDDFPSVGQLDAAARSVPVAADGRRARRFRQGAHISLHFFPLSGGEVQRMETGGRPKPVVARLEI